MLMDQVRRTRLSLARHDRALFSQGVVTLPIQGAVGTELAAQ